MKHYRQVSLFCGLALAIAALSVTRLAAAPPPTDFQIDVSTAIDRGIAWLTTNGAFSNPSSAGDSSGLPMLALLEKRASGNPADPPQGYNGAVAGDKALLKTAAAYILNRAHTTGAGFYAYRDGGWMFALAEYARTGGPDKSTLAPANASYDSIKEAMDRMVDRTLAAQRTASNGFPAAAEQGYWCYNNQFCKDSSTTQFAVAGLAAAKTFYSSAGSGDGGSWTDAVRVAAIDTALALAKQAYELNAGTGSDNGACRVLSATERGHGYHPPVEGYNPSLQQTASGIYIQLFGGSNLNTPMVQHYIEWVRNHYRWQDLDSMGNSWPTLSWSYYMWSSFKAMELIRQSGVAPTAGNLGPDDFGTLPSGGLPTCNARQDHKDPAVVSRPASFGAGGVGFYNVETKSQYFDYAHQILTVQCAPMTGNDGFFGCNGNPGYWGGGAYAHQSYLLLVLQRSTGGACVDTDGDGVCDADDNCPNVANADQKNSYGGPAGDACEARPQIKLNVSTAPGTGVAGFSVINVTGSAWPAAAVVTDVTIYIAPKCFEVNPVSTPATQLRTIIGGTKRASFNLPATVQNGLNYVWLAGPGLATTNCSKLTVSGGVNP